MSGAPAKDEVVGAFRKQVEWCANLGSPFTAALLAEAAKDLEGDSGLTRLLGSWPGNPVADGLALRIAGAAHALAMSRTDAKLSSCYPSPERTGDGQAAWDAVREALERDPGYFQAFITSPPQTNEVGRSGALLGGFLAIACATGLPMRLMEIGASAGLNLVFDRFHYTLGASTWGNTSSPVRLSPEWSGPSPDVGAPLSVASRHGCDLRPSDLEDEAQRRRLRSYVWADQTDRLARFDGAVRLARSEKVAVEKADAAEWVEKGLGERISGEVAVVYHSIVWQYLPPETKARITASLEKYGTASTGDMPLAWLRLEPDGPGNPYLKLTLWPGGKTATLARAHFHGASIDWIAG